MSGVLHAGWRKVTVTKAPRRRRHSQHLFSRTHQEPKVNYSHFFRLTADCLQRKWPLKSESSSEWFICKWPLLIFPLLASQYRAPQFCPRLATLQLDKHDMHKSSTISNCRGGEITYASVRIEELRLYSQTNLPCSSNLLQIK